VEFILIPSAGSNMQHHNLTHAVLLYFQLPITCLILSNCHQRLNELPKDDEKGKIKDKNKRTKI
jgi:hypothetical protein